MRNIYIVRHGQTENVKKGMCISQTDNSLNGVGIEQAKGLIEWRKAHPVSHIFSSPLKRCVETANIIAMEQKVEVCPELTEVSVGQWEGLAFDEIKKKWPQLYEERGQHLGTTAPPGGESFVEAGQRLDRKLRELLKETEGDILVVTHSGILRGWLCSLLEIPDHNIFSILVPCASVTHVSWDEKDFCVKTVGDKPQLFPGDVETQALFETYGTTMENQDHGYAVAALAMELARGNEIKFNLLYKACILHDFCRRDGRTHPKKAAEIMLKHGYPELAEIIGQHHDLSENPTKEAELLYLADKMVRGVERCSVRERFLESRKKCKSKEAFDMWQKRYLDSLRLLGKYGGDQVERISRTDIGGRDVLSNGGLQTPDEGGKHKHGSARGEHDETGGNRKNSGSDWSSPGRIGIPFSRSGAGVCL